MNFTLINISTGQPILHEPETCCTATALETPNANLTFRLLTLSHCRVIAFIYIFTGSTKGIVYPEQSDFTWQYCYIHPSVHFQALSLLGKFDWAHRILKTQTSHRSLRCVVAALGAVHVICLCTVCMAASSLIWAICTVCNAVAHQVWLQALLTATLELVRGTCYSLTCKHEQHSCTHRFQQQFKVHENSFTTLQLEFTHYRHFTAHITKHPNLNWRIVTVSICK